MEVCVNSVGIRRHQRSAAGDLRSRITAHKLKKGINYSNILGESIRHCGKALW